MTKPGERVAVILNTDPDTNTVNLLGYGVYEGDHPRPGSEPPPEDDLAMCRQVIEDNDRDGLLEDVPVNVWHAEVQAGRCTREHADQRIAEGRARRQAERARPIEDRALDLYRLAALNPRLRLDNGQICWGYQVWWCSEHDFHQRFAGWTINPHPD